MSAGENLPRGPLSPAPPGWPGTPACWRLERHRVAEPTPSPRGRPPTAGPRPPGWAGGGPGGFSGRWLGTEGRHRGPRSHSPGPPGSRPGSTALPVPVSCGKATSGPPAREGRPSPLPRFPLAPINRRSPVLRVLGRLRGPRELPRLALRHWSHHMSRTPHCKSHHVCRSGRRRTEPLMRLEKGWPRLISSGGLSVPGRSDEGDCFFLITLLIDIKQKGLRLVACN